MEPLMQGIQRTLKNWVFTCKYILLGNYHRWCIDKYSEYSWSMLFTYNNIVIWGNYDK